MNDVTLRLRRLHSRDTKFESELARIVSFEAAQDDRIDATVARLIADVRARGDAALIEHTAIFDGVRAASMADLEISADEMRRSGFVSYRSRSLVIASIMRFVAVSRAASSFLPPRSSKRIGLPK